MGISNNHAIWKAEADGIDLLNTTIGDLLDQQAAAIPAKEALVYNYPELGLNLRLTYHQYREEADRLAKGLLALGIEKGEHVAVWATNLPEWALLEMAVAKIGAVLDDQYQLPNRRTGVCAAAGRHHDPVHDRGVSRQLLP